MRLLIFLLGFARAISFFEVVLEEWEVWKAIHDKSYNTSTEEKFRLKIFMENKVKVAKHNNLASQGHHNYFLKLNHFGDLLNHEFALSMNGCYRSDMKKAAASMGATFISPAHVTLPKEVDWRREGAVTPVKNQGQCGACWAFASTGALEGQHFRKTGKLVALSEQNLVDCSASYGNKGCEGGLMDNAFKYINDNGGLDTELSYPYEGAAASCRYNQMNKGASDLGYIDIPYGDEKALMEAVATVGPVAVAIDASHESFQFYSHGIYSDVTCDSSSLDHGVLVVGYGQDQETGRKYWLIKNSWGESWGEEGFIKMARDENNLCGVASAASFPLV